MLAFRLSGITSQFPGIATQRDVVEVAGKNHWAAFRSWKPTAEESLRYFKGENWGTKSLYTSIDSRPRIFSRKAVLKRSKAAIQNAERLISNDGPLDPFSRSLHQALLTGPTWGRGVASDYMDFVRNGLLNTLKTVVSVMERAATT